MKLLVASDIHGSDRAVRLIARQVSREKPDVTVICGDITHFGTPERTKEIIDSIEGLVLAVPGNCDPPGVEEGLDESNGVNLHGTTFTVGNVVFAGYGGAKRMFGTMREYGEAKLGENVRRLLPGTDVLVLHCPPYGINDLSPRGNAGSREILEAVRVDPPLLVLSGHIHECPGIVREGKTTFINPGASRDGRVTLLEIDEEAKAIVDNSIRMIRENRYN